MSRLTVLKGSLFSVLAFNFVFVGAAMAQPGAGGAPVRPSVVAGFASEAVPVTKKKYVGNVEAIEQVDSVARVSGTLTVAPGFEEGSRVKKGQLLFVIDPIPYQAKVEAAKATIAETEARIEYAKSNFNRLSDLYSKNAGSKDDMESAHANLKSLEASLLSAKAQLTLAEEDLKYTRIISEIDGRAGRRAYSTGNYVSLQSQPLVRVVQMDPIYVRFTMSERDYLSMFGNANALKANSSIELSLANGAAFQGKGEISFVDNSVKSTTDTIKIWAKFDNPQEILNPGGVVTVNLAKPDSKSVPTVEPAAILFDGQENYVYVLVDSIDDDALFAEICADSRFAGKEDLEKAKESPEEKAKYLEKFKQERYRYVDPKTKESVDDFAGNKVNEKYRMVLRRNVTLGPATPSANSIYSGIQKGEVVMMDGVNKARPFDLVIPVFRDKSKGADETDNQKNQTQDTNLKTADQPGASPASNAKQTNGQTQR